MKKKLSEAINEKRIANGLNPIDFSVASTLVKEDRIADSILTEYVEEQVLLRTNTNDINRELAIKIVQNSIKSYGKNLSLVSEILRKYGFQKAILAMLELRCKEIKAHPQNENQLEKEIATLYELYELRSLLVDKEFIDEVTHMKTANDETYC